MLAEIRDSEDRDHALAAAKHFDHEYKARFPKAAAKITDDLDRLVTSTTSRPRTGSISRPRTRSSLRSRPCGLRTKVTKGAGSRAAGLAMAFKLIAAAQDRWRKGQRTRTRRARTRRRDVRERQADREPRRGNCRVINDHTRSTSLDYFSLRRRPPAEALTLALAAHHPHTKYLPAVAPYRDGAIR